MRCQTARKWISDELDGALPSGRGVRLEAHLRTCRACRVYREDLERIQAGTGLPEAPAGFWAAFERELEARLAAEEAGRKRVEVPFAAGRRWAWAAAAALVLAGVSLWFALPRPGPAMTEAWVAGDDILDPIVRAVESDPELAGRIDRELQASIEAMSPVGEAEAAGLTPADPLFWESLSDDELRAVVAALEKESGLGGPQ
jgi:anti-sigma factor RsiW